MKFHEILFCPYALPHFWGREAREVAGHSGDSPDHLCILWSSLIVDCTRERNIIGWKNYVSNLTLILKKLKKILFCSYYVATNSVQGIFYRRLNSMFLFRFVHFICFLIPGTCLDIMFYCLTIQKDMCYFFSFVSISETKDI